MISLSAMVLAIICSVSVFGFDTDDSGMRAIKEYGAGVELVNYNGTQIDVYVTNKTRRGEII